MRILARHAMNIAAALCLVLISSPRLVFATTLSITSPPALSSVSATVPFSCTDSAAGATVNLYIDNVYTAGGRSPFSYSWHTTAASNGPHYLVCNGYVKSKTNGGTSESVTVRNSNISTVSGVAIQNVMLRATITAIAVNANGSDCATLATTTANNNGQFSLNVPVQSGPVRFRATGGSYISEQNAAGINYPSPLSVLLPSLPGNLSGLSLNPLTTFVDSLAQGNIGRGQNLATALGNATASIEDDYGISTDPSVLTPLYTEAAIGTDAGRLGLILGAIVNQDQLLCPKTAGGLVGALSSDIFDGIFDGKKSGTAIAYCGGKLTAIAGNAQSSDALSGLQQLTLSTRAFAFGGNGNALTLNGVTAAEVSEDVAIIESALVATAPPSVNMFAATTPSMNVARAGATATLLPNGKVLIAGGTAISDSSPLSSTELYDSATNTFAPPAATPVMNTARSAATATLLPNGKVLIAGGLSNIPPYEFASTELYDPATNKFAPPAATPVMNTARAGAPATLLPNGKVLFAGGDINSFPPQLASTELYDPATNKFAPSAMTPVMNTARAFANATLLPNGKVLIVGGGFAYQVIATELYDPVTNTFAPPAATPVLNTAGVTASATVLPSGKVLFADGESDYDEFPNSIVLYDPATNMFGPATSAPEMFGRDYATVTLLPNGKVLFAGGRTLISFPPYVVDSLNSTELYDPITNTFATSTPVMNTTRAGATATLLPNGKVLIAGGSSSVAAELYTP